MECNNAEHSHFFSCCLHCLSLCHIAKSFFAPSKELFMADREQIAAFTSLKLSVIMGRKFLLGEHAKLLNVLMCE